MAENEAGKKRGKLKTIIIVVLALLLAVGLSVAGTLWFLSGSDSMDTGEGDGESAETHTPASYHELEEPLIVSISGDRQRYLQIHLALVMREDDVSATLKQHMPTIRSRLRSLLQDQSFKQLQGTEGKEKLLEDMADTVNSVLEGEGSHSIERVLFTNFVMQ